MQKDSGSKNRRTWRGSRTPPDLDVNQRSITEACERDIELCKGSSNCRGLAQLIAEAIRRWSRVDREFSVISDPSQKKRLLTAIKLVQSAAGVLHPLILGDGRFKVRGDYLQLAEFVKGFPAEEGGRRHQLAAACCAEDLASYFRQERGEPRWDVVGRIIERRFPQLQPPTKKRKNKRGQTLARYTRDMVRRNRRWWQKLRERTWIDPLGSFWQKRNSLNAAQQEEERKRFQVYQHTLLARTWRRVELKRKRRTAKLKRDGKGQWVKDDARNLGRRLQISH